MSVEFSDLQDLQAILKVLHDDLSDASNVKLFLLRILAHRQWLSEIFSLAKKVVHKVIVDLKVACSDNERVALEFLELVKEVLNTVDQHALRRQALVLCRRHHDPR